MQFKDPTGDDNPKKTRSDGLTRHQALFVMDAGRPLTISRNSSGSGRTR